MAEPTFRQCLDVANQILNYGTSRPLTIREFQEFVERLDEVDAASNNKAPLDALLAGVLEDFGYAIVKLDKQELRV